MSMMTMDPSEGLLYQVGLGPDQIGVGLATHRLRLGKAGAPTYAVLRRYHSITLRAGQVPEELEQQMGAVQLAIAQLSPEAPRANLMMAAMDEFARHMSDVDAKEYQETIKAALDNELDLYPRPEIPGTHQEFMQIADSETKTARTYEGTEKRKRVRDLAKHGIPLKEEFEKEPPTDTPPGRRLTAAESRDGFAVGDKVRDQAVSELTGVVAGFGANGAIKVTMDASTYCPDGGIGLYLPGGLLKLGPDINAAA